MHVIIHDGTLEVSFSLKIAVHSQFRKNWILIGILDAQEMRLSCISKGLSEVSLKEKKDNEEA